MDWKKRLNKKELMHLMDSGVTDLEGAKKNFALQARMRVKHPRNPDPCFHCGMIERKLKDKGVIK